MTTRHEAFQEGFNRHVFLALSRFLKEIECEPNTSEERQQLKEMTSDSLASVRQQVLRYEYSVRVRRIFEMESERAWGSNVIPFPSTNRSRRTA